MLLRLRSRNEDRLLWIDQICINQDDGDEKESQVKRMKDIFGGATRVIASLGPHYAKPIKPSHQYQTVRPRPRSGRMDLEKSEVPIVSYLEAGYKTQRPDVLAKQRAMDLIRKWNLRSILPLSKSIEEDVLALLQSDWFNRIWVVQEVAVAKNLLLICGDEEIDGSRFKRMYGRILDNAKNTQLRSRVEELRPLLKYISREASDGRSKPELLDLLQKFRSWKATEAHDKVFALLGLSEEGVEVPLLRPDYKVSAEVVFRRVAEHMMIRYRSLAVVTYAMQTSTYTPTTLQSWTSWLFGGALNSILRANTDDPGEDAYVMPSWCPDWREQYEFPRHPQAVSRPGISLFGAMDSVSSLSKSGVLSVTGLILATIQAILDRGIDVSIPANVRSCTRDLAASCGRISVYLHQLGQSTKRSFKKGDCICLLNGCTGIVVLRPHGIFFKLVVMEHSMFDQVEGLSVPLSRQTFGLNVRELFFGDCRSVLQNLEIL